MKRPAYLTIFTIFFLIESSYSKPSEIDYFKTGAGLSTLLFSQYVYKKKNDHFQNYKIENVNSFDSFFRSKIKWKENNLNKANFYSDILLYGAALGSIPISASIIDRDYCENILFLLNVLSVNGIITNFTKNISSRERPIYRHDSSRRKTNESYKSFYSGHTSTVFAIGTSTSLLLSNQFPKSKNFIWLTTLSLASLTGYYRIASDNHYTTDVMFGALMGITAGYLMYKEHIKHESKLSFTINSINYSYYIH